MAEDSEKSLFRKSALNRIANADDLDKAIKVSNPSAWMSISAFLAFAIGIIVWAVFAVVPITTTAVAVTDGTQTATCWVDADTAQQLSSPDARVSIAGKEATRCVVASRPRSSAEVAHSLDGSYLVDGLNLAPWNYRVDLEFAENLYTPEELGGEDEILTSVQIVTREEHPITLVFGN